MNQKFIFLFLWRERFNLIEHQRLNLVLIFFASKIDCIHFIFLQVFDVSYFSLVGSIESPKPPIDPPEI